MKQIYQAEFEDLHQYLRYFLIILMMSIALFDIVVSIFAAIDEGFLIGILILFLLVAIEVVFLVCAYLAGLWCFSLSYSNRGKHPNFAFIIGFLFGMIGVAAYYILSDG